jgi:dihydropteroate synthase
VGYPAPPNAPGRSGWAPGKGTIAALAVCAWLGARVFRVHNVPATRAALAAVAEMQAAT